MGKTIYQKNFEKLDLLLGGIEAFMKSEEHYMKLKAAGFMDLSIDVLGNSRIAIAHNFVQNGDLMADPDMEIRVELNNRTAEALTFQNDSLGVYQEVYPSPGKVYPALKRDLNQFLGFWLDNLKLQGFSKKEETSEKEMD